MCLALHGQQGYRPSGSMRKPCSTLQHESLLARLGHDRVMSRSLYYCLSLLLESQLGDLAQSPRPRLATIK